MIKQLGEGNGLFGYIFLPMKKVNEEARSETENNLQSFIDANIIMKILNLLKIRLHTKAQPFTGNTFYKKDITRFKENVTNQMNNA